MEARRLGWQGVAGTHERFTLAWSVRSDSCASKGHKSFLSYEDKGTQSLPR